MIKCSTEGRHDANVQKMRVRTSRQKRQRGSGTVAKTAGATSGPATPGQTSVRPQKRRCAFCSARWQKTPSGCWGACSTGATRWYTGGSSNSARACRSRRSPAWSRRWSLTRCCISSGQKNKAWVIKALDRGTRRIVAWVLGGRDSATFRKLYDKMRHLNDCVFYTHHHRPFQWTPKNRTIYISVTTLYIWSKFYPTYCSSSKIVLIEDENAHARRFGGRAENGLGWGFCSGNLGLVQAQRILLMSRNRYKSLPKWAMAYWR